jgi:hypothetical protein
LFSAVHPARNADVFAKKAAKTEVVEQTLKNVNEEGTTTVMLGAGPALRVCPERIPVFSTG